MVRAGGVPLTILAAALCPAATLLRSPYLQDVGSNRATVLWVTREAGSGRVEFSADGTTWRVAPAEARRLPSHSDLSRYQYRADLPGLLPGRTYNYRVVVDEQVLRDNLRFRTAESGPFTFLVFGDSGTGSEAQAAVARRLLAEQDVSLVLHTGDISQDDGSLDRMEAHYFSVYAPLMSRAPFFPTLGNHDYGTDLAAPYLSVHVLPASDTPAADLGRYYSFDWGDVHFVSLDSNLLVSATSTRRMLEWLERDLQRTRSFWKLAFLHHPPFPSGHHLEDSLSARVRTLVLPILERHGVQVVFSGHEHTYQRSKLLRDGQPVNSLRGIVCIITGGGGADLHPVGSLPQLAFGEAVHHYLRVRVEAWRLEITAVASDGRIVDRSTIAPPPEILPQGVVNAASFTPNLAPGSLVSLFGFNLATGLRVAPGLPLPTELGETGATLNGQPLPLLFVSPTQINAQLPYGIEGPATLRLKTPNAETEAFVRLERAAPAILNVFVGAERVPAVLRNATGTLVTSVSPAWPGETLSIFLVGLGAVAGAVVAGHPAPSRPPLTLPDPVKVWVDDVVVAPFFAGLAPGFAGLYQVNVTLPHQLMGGSHSLRVEVGGVSSPPVTLVVGEDSRTDY